METLSLIYFSPTGTTQKIVREIGQQMNLELISENNITQIQTKIEADINSDLTIIGVPVYSGRLPLKAAESLKKFKSNKSPVVIVAVYGNANSGDALLELKEIAANCGFIVVAGALFIGEHSFTSIDKPLAKDRPDQQDLLKCKDFADMIKEKMNAINDINTLADLDIPGNFPYKALKQLPAKVHPETDTSLCINCGKCAEVCPTNAITIEDTVITNGELCIWCCACVKNCPREVRIFDNPTINAVKEKLFLNFSERQEPKYFV